jgi:hypothetical protein
VKQTMMWTSSRRWFAPGASRVMAPSETFAAFAVVPRALHNRKLKIRERIDERNVLRDNKRASLVDISAGSKKTYRSNADCCLLFMLWT